MNSNYFNISKLYRTPENSMSSSHTHSFWELFYLTKGSCSILIRDALYEINEGTIFLIPCDISHKTIYSNTDNERIVIELGDDYVAPIISGFPDLTFYNKYCCHFFTFNLSASNLINYYFDTVLLESKKHSSISSLTIRHSIQGIILCIIRSGFDITASLNVRNSLQTENTIIQNAIDYIEQNFSANISLTALAEHLHLNPSYLSKLFKDETEMTFKDFLNRIRISHAERLLLETNLPMSDVASLCGYESGNYFGDVFKKTKGISAIKFREAKGYIE